MALVEAKIIEGARVARVDEVQLYGGRGQAAFTLCISMPETSGAWLCLADNSTDCAHADACMEAFNGKHRRPSRKALAAATALIASVASDDEDDDPSETD